MKSNTMIQRVLIGACVLVMLIVLDPRLALLLSPILMVVLPWLATEVCWFALKSRRPSTRINAYVVCTVAMLTLGSWLIGIAHARNLGDRGASSSMTAGAFQVASGMLALLCISWGTRALLRSRALAPAAFVLYLLALPLAFLSFLCMYAANTG